MRFATEAAYQAWQRQQEGTSPVSGTVRGKGRLTTPQYASKLERDYATLLERRKQAGELHAYWYEPFALKLGAKCFYHPDFLTQTPDGTLTIVECKGFWRDDARVKIKVAASQYPCFQFLAVTYKHKEWLYEAF